MIRMILTLMSVTMLAGCATSDMLNNDFPSVVEVSAPKGLIGAWTGSSGPYSTTMVIKESGAGLACYSWNGKDTTVKIKYDGREIRWQDGARLKIKRINDSYFIASAPYYMGSDYVFSKDTKLENASPYCEKELSNHLN
ncbi:J517_1871 family lipoprotein [Klebsiella sp. NPDC088457]